MGEVVDFRAYKEGKELLVMTAPCPLPFHHEDYVRDLECRRCGLRVTLTTHPSFDAPRWYTDRTE